MNGLRFKVGELAVFVVSRTPEGTSFVGQWVTVYMTGGLDADFDQKDYGIEHPDGTLRAAMDWQLQKIDPPAEPASLTRDNECEVLA